jgi:hypothetical protein
MEPNDAGGRGDHGTHGEWPPGRPPRPLDAPPRDTREFAVDGVRWLAWVAGGGVGGTGGYNLALLESVLFAPADAPEPPLLEILLPHGAFIGLHDAELVVLLGRATRIGRGPEDAPRRNRSGGHGGRNLRG